MWSSNAQVIWSLSILWALHTLASTPSVADRHHSGSMYVSTALLRFSTISSRRDSCIFPSPYNCLSPITHSLSKYHTHNILCIYLINFVAFSHCSTSPKPRTNHHNRASWYISTWTSSDHHLKSMNTAAIGFSTTYKPWDLIQIPMHV